MFTDACLDDRVESRRPWTIAVSFLAQGLAIAAVILASLLTAGDLPARQWVAHLLAPPAMPPAAAPPEPVRARSVQPVTERFPEGALVSPVKIPDEVALVADSPAESTSSIDRSPGVGVVGSRGQGGIDNFIAGLTATREIPPPAPKAETKPSGPREPVRVGGDVQQARLIRRVAPRYPPLALKMRVSGVVELKAVIGEDGAIRELRVIAGHPLLVESAIKAVQQWRYRPTVLNGVAVPVLTQVNVHFRLGQ